MICSPGRWPALCGLLLALLVPAMQSAAAPLPTLNIKRDATSVSGLSSGAYMAVQFHVANSSFVKGAGIIAGGPYFCAGDNQQTALTVCSCISMPCNPALALQRVPDYQQVTEQNASRSAIDATSNLANSKVWLFTGTDDAVVPAEPVTALRDYYSKFMNPANISLVTDVPADHAMPTDRFGNDCNFRGEPFINKCPFDAAGQLLKWIYGSLNPRNEGTLSGRLIEFDQSDFLPNPAQHGMYPKGWAYVPQRCDQLDQCRVHVAFHGCKQYPDWPFAGGPGGKMGDTFARHAGYNEWADANHIVVLYPQANSMTLGTRPLHSNPTGCWDWWGYDDANYALREGRQMAAVRRMVDRLAGVATPVPVPVPVPAFCGKARNAEHVAAGRARVFLFWWYVANGTGDYLGMNGEEQTTLKELPQGTYRKVSACP